MIEIKIVGSGGQGAVVAGKLLGIAAGKSGYQTQSFASYGYARRGGIVESYVRISKEKINLHTRMYKPHFLVLMNEAYAENPDFLKGFEQGRTILINSTRSPDQFPSLAKFEVRTVDADRIALQAGLKLPSGLPVINSAIMGAVLGILSIGSIDALADAIREGGIPFPEKNLEAAGEAIRRVNLQTAGGVKDTAVGGGPPVAGAEEDLPSYRSGIAPCENNCPACGETRNTVSFIQADQMERALENIRDENPFPGICGRVCHHPCEPHCNRNEFDEGISLSALERAAFDYADRSKVRKPAKREGTGKKVAVVGSGPAGMTCACFLCLLGHEVTVFEALPVPGGIPRVGIPAYRLPRNVVDREIGEIVELGVMVRTGTEVGKDIPFDDIMDQYDACFVAAGAHRPNRLDIPGEDGRGVVSGLDFLKEIAFGRQVELGERVVVIGGGNTAVDAARTAKRLGSADVTIIYRRSVEEMTAYRSEVQAAEKEGVRLLHLTVPVQIHGHGRTLQRVECVKTVLSHREPDGRRSVKPVEGSNFLIEADAVIVALGESVDARFLPKDIETADGLIKVDCLGRTSKIGVFAGGDLTTSRRSAVEAVASGKRAAVGVDIYLKALGAEMSEAPLRNESGNFPFRAYVAGQYSPVSGETVSFKDLNLSYFSKTPRIRGAEAEPSNRISGLEEVNPGLTREEAISESERCFQCGRCTLCGNCYSYCPDLAVVLEDGAFSINRQLCKRCGICVEECPRKALAWSGGGA